MAENFNLIFGQNASQSYAWSDSDYQNGWQTVGDTPPTAQQFDALQRRADLKAQELNNALTPLITANNKNNRKPSTTYAEENIQYSDDLPTGWFLECTVAGKTSAGALVVPSPVHVNDTITDGTVTWTVKKTGSGNGDGVPLGTILPIAHNSTLPAGYLLCDGSAVSRTMYPDLFACIGTTYGAGDGSTTFNVPDYNAAERFCQGGATAGVVKQAGLPNITGTYGNKNGNAAVDLWGDPSPTGAFGASTFTSGAYSSGTSSDGRGIINFDASASNPIYGNSTTVQPNALTARYIIKAFDGQTASSALIDITQYANELAGKANRQLSNLDTANLACHVVVDSYYDSTTGNWYRVYDDGWIEQGGKESHNVVANFDTKINLLKPMADNNYGVQITPISNYTTGGGLLYGSVYTATTTQLSYGVGTHTPQYVHSIGSYWEIAGMGASV